ncbi:MAG: inositol 2-dehydrogenase [Chloroflexi bacterium]|nr:inositol 2-dehydrogenase [Chloroflexota bacterium]
MIAVGLIGAGRIGRLHAAHLAHHIPHARLVAVADVAEAAARECAAEHAIPLAVGDFRVLLDDANIAALVICSATDTHAQIIEAAAGSGKHIFCEKPIDLSLARIDGALAAVERAGVVLQVGFNRRFDANFRRARVAVEQGEIGRPWRLHLISRDPSPPPLAYMKTSGGLFLDMAIHDFDMARFLIGSEVDEVYSTAGVLVDEAIGALGDVDTAVTVLKFGNGVIGTIDNSRCAVYGYDQRVEILGSRGMVATDNNFPSTTVISDGGSVHRDLPLNFFMERYTTSYLTEMTAFVDAVRQGTPPPVGGADGRLAVVLGLAAQKSYRENRPVRVAEVESTRSLNNLDAS